jgi:hypothetical protein
LMYEPNPPELKSEYIEAKRARRTKRLASGKELLGGPRFTKSAFPIPKMISIFHSCPENYG